MSISKFEPLMVRMSEFSRIVIALINGDLIHSKHIPRRQVVWRTGLDVNMLRKLYAKILKAQIYLDKHEQYVDPICLSCSLLFIMNLV